MEKRQSPRLRPPAPHGNELGQVPKDGGGGGASQAWSCKGGGQGRPRPGLGLRAPACPPSLCAPHCFPGLPSLGCEGGRCRWGSRALGPEVNEAKKGTTEMLAPWVPDTAAAVTCAPHSLHPNLTPQQGARRCPAGDPRENLRGAGVLRASSSPAQALPGAPGRRCWRLGSAGPQPRPSLPPRLGLGFAAKGGASGGGVSGPSQMPPSPTTPCHRPQASRGCRMGAGGTGAWSLEPSNEGFFREPEPSSEGRRALGSPAGPGEAHLGRRFFSPRPLSRTCSLPGLQMRLV